MNLCAACKEDFAGVSYFDAHRVGTFEYEWSPEHEDGRRCLSTEELEARGWHLDSRGRWSDPVEAERARQNLRPTYGIRHRGAASVRVGVTPV